MTDKKDMTDLKRITSIINDMKMYLALVETHLRDLAKDPAHERARKWLALDLESYAKKLDELHSAGAKGELDPAASLGAMLKKMPNGREIIMRDLGAKAALWSVEAVMSGVRQRERRAAERRNALARQSRASSKRKTAKVIPLPRPPKPK